MAPVKKAEYDDYINEYRATQNKQIAIFGETGDFFAEYKVKKLAEWLPGLAAKPLAVLDYGCGDGLMASYVRRYFSNASVYGVDPSSKSIEQARANHPEVEFSSAQDVSLPFPSGAMDIVFASGVFHHIPFAAHRQSADEVFRVLKPGGQFVLFELNPFNPLTLKVFLTSPFDRNAKLMFPRYSKKFFQNYGDARIKYYAFFPHMLAYLRPLERYLTKFPIGALYACLVKKQA